MSVSSVGLRIEDTGLSEPGVWGGLCPFKDFGRSVYPISIRGTYYAHHITTRPHPPGFIDLPKALKTIKSVGTAACVLQKPAKFLFSDFFFFLKSPQTSTVKLTKGVGHLSTMSLIQSEAIRESEDYWKIVNIVHMIGPECD